jgi:hypothetical protein
MGSNTACFKLKTASLAPQMSAHETEISPGLMKGRFSVSLDPRGGRVTGLLQVSPSSSGLRVLFFLWQLLDSSCEEMDGAAGFMAMVSVLRKKRDITSKA